MELTIRYAGNNRVCAVRITQVLLAENHLFIAAVSGLCDEVIVCESRMVFRVRKKETIDFSLPRI